MTQTWDDVALRCATDKSSAFHDYVRAYERFIREPVASVLEVGVDRGHSLRMWAELFPGASVLGIDVNPECVRDLGNPRITIAIGDATNPEDLRRICGAGGFDLIVDDGSPPIRDVLPSY